MIYLQLFLSFLQVGAFSFGGGYAALPLIQNQVVVQNQWMTMAEFNDLITISQMTPGPIAINSATFVGTRVAGVTGALIATFASVLPSIIIVTILAWIYFRFRDLSVLQTVLETLRPAVVAMIATAGASILLTAFWGEEVVGISTLNIGMVLIFLLSLFLLLRLDWDAVLVMFLAGILNLIFYYFGELVSIASTML